MEAEDLFRINVGAGGVTGAGAGGGTDAGAGVTGAGVTGGGVEGWVLTLAKYFVITLCRELLAGKFNLIISLITFWQVDGERVSKENEGLWRYSNNINR